MTSIEKYNANLPAESTKRRGFEEGVDKQDIIIPRAKLLQALSPEIVDSLDGMKAGLIINSITKQQLPAEFVPVFKFTNWVRFNPRDTKAVGYDANYKPGDVIWSSSDPLDKRVVEEGKFGPNGERPLATKFLNFFAHFPDAEMPVIVSFSNTSYKAGKQLLSLCQFTQGDMFSRKYKLGSKHVKSDVGAYYVLTVDPIGKASDDEYKYAEGLWQTFASKARDIEVHGETETAAEPF